VELYDTDELTYHGGLRVSFCMQLMGAAARIEREIPTIGWPFLLLHGDDDKLCDIKGSKMMYEKASAADKKLKVRSVAYRTFDGTAWYNTVKEHEIIPSTQTSTSFILK